MLRTQGYRITKLMLLLENGYLRLIAMAILLRNAEQTFSIEAVRGLYRALGTKWVILCIYISSVVV